MILIGINYNYDANTGLRVKAGLRTCPYDKIYMESSSLSWYGFVQTCPMSSLSKEQFAQESEVLPGLVLANLSLLDIWSSAPFTVPFTYTQLIWKLPIDLLMILFFKILLIDVDKFIVAPGLLFDLNSYTDCV